MRRQPSTQWRYLINVNKDHLEAHDLDNEKSGLSQCQIDEIIKAGNAYYLLNVNNPTDLVLWLNQNPTYDGCKYCLAGLHRK